jgi:phospholipid/cholesterol/gamma-HCH transport system ATP-binding protein
MIKVSNVEKSFGKNRVLRGATLEIKEGETLTIMGGSGTGKSVLLKHMVGIMRPDKGTISVDGKEVSSMGEDELLEVQKRFGYLFQGAALFDSMTVGENIAFGIRNLRPDLIPRLKDVIVEKLGFVGLQPEIANLKPAELSGGMKKRVGLARAIAYEPDYILYDEPTTGLDPIMSDVINDLILGLQKRLKVTSVVVTHDMKSAFKISDRIAMLFEGRIVAVGTADERPTRLRTPTTPWSNNLYPAHLRGPSK